MISMCCEDCGRELEFIATCEVCEDWQPAKVEPKLEVCSKSGQEIMPWLLVRFSDDLPPAVGYYNEGFVYEDDGIEMPFALEVKEWKKI